MTEKELRKLSRADLLEMLIDQGTELLEVRERLDTAEAALLERELKINTAGSIAEASLQLNGVFEASQAACEQYLENIRLLSERQEEVCRQLEQECRERVEQELAETQQRCEKMEAEVKAKCAKMVAKAKSEAQAYWDEVSGKLDAYYAEHVGLREILSTALTKKE